MQYSCLSLFAHSYPPQQVCEWYFYRILPWRPSLLLNFSIRRPREACPRSPLPACAGTSFAGTSFAEMTRFESQHREPHHPLRPVHLDEAPYLTEHERVVAGGIRLQLLGPRVHEGDGSMVSFGEPRQSTRAWRAPAAYPERWAGSGPPPRRSRACGNPTPPPPAPTTQPLPTDAPPQPSEPYSAVAGDRRTAGSRHLFVPACSSPWGKFAIHQCRS